MDFWECVVSLFGLAGFLSPVVLVIWEVMWGQRRSVANRRRPQQVESVPAAEVDRYQESELAQTLRRGGGRILPRRTLRFRLKTVFYVISTACLLLAIWKAFSLPIAVILSVCVLVGVPLTFLVVSDLTGKRNAAREFLAERKGKLEMPDFGESIHDESPVAVSASGTSGAASRSLPRKDKEPKWWLRRWPTMRLGRFGIWN